jgi:hypothetical protein
MSGSNGATSTRPLTSDLVLVGSLPADDTDAAFRAGAAMFGDLVAALPDGETGARAGWVGFERNTLLRPHPDIEVVSELGSPTRPPRHFYETPSFKLREGVEELRFQTWPRIDEALASWHQFRALRDEGVIPAGLRFQVSLPFPTSALSAFRADFAHDYPVAGPAYEELLIRELGRLFSEVPAQDLAVQFDVCWEVLDLEDVVSWMGDGAWERFAGPVQRITPHVPTEALVGFHLCYGTFPDWPMFEARDYSLLVRMANFAVEHAGRPVDWLHMAGPKYYRSEDRRFFAPLADLAIGDTRPFLGIVLPLDGVEGLKMRYATAKQFLDDFGVAMYCGFGRQPGRDGLETMREHRETVLAGVLGPDHGCYAEEGG